MALLSTRNFRSLPALLRFFGTTIICVAADLWTKYLAVEYLKYTGRSIRFIPGFLHFDYVENHGAVFGIGQGQRWLFVAVSVGAIGFLTFLFATSGWSRFYQVLLGMLLAGVLGNMYDRIRYGYVRDMLHALPNWNVFPWVFNVADSMLCVGVGLMLLYSGVHKPPSDDDEVRASMPERSAESV